MSKPKPLADPHAGKFEVVITFRLANVHFNTAEKIRRVFRGCVVGFNGLEGLTVAVRQIGAQGETSADEGRWERSPVLKEDIKIEGERL